MPVNNDAVAIDVLPAVQTVSSAPGDAGSRAALLPRPDGRRSKAGGKVMTEAQAVARLKDAELRDLRFVLQQDNPKTGESRERYEVYKSATSVREWKQFANTMVTAGGRPTRVVKGSFTSLGGDAVSDLCRGYITILYPDDDQATSAAVVGKATSTAGRPEAEGSVPVVRAMAVRGITGPTWGLEEEEVRETVAALRAFGSAFESTRAGLGPNLPEALVPAALAAVTTPESGTVLSEGENMTVKLPLDMDELLKRPDREQIIEAIRAEVSGMEKRQVFDVVPWKPGIKPIRTMLFVVIKSSGKYKARIVALGNQTKGNGVHYDETATSMVSQTAIKMLVAYAAGEGQKLWSADFTQAFLYAPMDREL